MKTIRSGFGKTGVAVLLIAGLLGLAGCGNGKEAKQGSAASTAAPSTGQTSAAPSTAPSTEASASPSSTAAATAAPAASEKLPVLKIAASDWAYVAEAKGWFKEAFDSQGTKVELVQGTLGNEAQLIARNDLHFANRMLYPLLQYKSQGADLKVVQVSDHPKPDIASILVLADSPVKTFADLKGKKIASWRAGCPYMVLYEKAEKAGWKVGADWTYVNVPSGENKTALLSKQVDAVSTHLLGDVAALLVNGTAREVANPDEDSVYVNGGGVTVTFTSSAFAKDYPETTRNYLAVKAKSEAWILQNEDEAAQIVQGVSRVPADISKLAWDHMKSTWNNSGKDLATIQAETAAMQDWLIAHGDIEASKKVDVSTIFDAHYFK